jgi:predicted metal-dependent phosphoesterase TrpH
LHSIDLHCHSDRSDGALPPQALIERAAARGVRIIALTDHDTLEGLSAAAETAKSCGIDFINGVEVSVSWGSVTLHVLGLRVDPSESRLAAGLVSIRAGRLRRAEAIALRLESKGIAGSLSGALALAANPEMVSRTHFARHLVASGVVKNMKTAFQRFLGEDKPAFVRHRWSTLGDAIGWIRGAGGVAVLAHPGRYGLRPARLHTLLSEFKSLGGEAVEVVTSSHTPQDVEQVANLACELGLRASAGSDFHSPEESWLDFGQLRELPPKCDPVWRDWPECSTLTRH